ncbi:MAG: hypothetical protein ACXWXZ_18410 [Candidatus Binatia bacterium]
MPIRNMGTLIENVVLVEVMRLLSQVTSESTSVDFLNSFAMPPLSSWHAHRTDYGFSADQLNALQAGPQPEPRDSYQGLLWLCLQQPPVQPGTEGPNGALLCGLFAQTSSHPVRFWLNDIPDGHYGNALPALATLNETVRRVAGAAACPQNTVIACDAPWPECQASLGETAAQWRSGSRGRVGFLDPMRYRVAGAKGGETDSESHGNWLRLLADGMACPVISVHFTGHNDWPFLRPEIRRMHADGFVASYTQTLVARHSYYHVVCNIRSPQGVDAGRALTKNLRGLREKAWKSWFVTIERRPDDLTIEVF